MKSWLHSDKQLWGSNWCNFASQQKIACLHPRLLSRHSSKLSVCILCRLLPGQMENTGLSYLSSSVWRSNYQSSTGQKDCILLFFKCHHPLRYDNKTLRNLVSKSSKHCAEVSLQSHGTHLKNSICASQSTVAQWPTLLLAATTIMVFVQNQVLDLKSKSCEGWEGGHSYSIF